MHIRTDKSSYSAKPRGFDETTLLGLIPLVKLLDGTPGSESAIGVSGNPFFVNGTVGIGGVANDAGGRVRVSQYTTLGDYKTLGYDRTLLLENAGTGTGTWSANKFNMTVGANQWYVRASRRPHAYFSGKSQVVEGTFDGFQPQANVTKRFGYMSSSTVSPFSAALDGFWIESGNGSISLKCSRAGTLTLDKDITTWSGYGDIGVYQNVANWENFTVVLFDFLWLGGAILRLWIKTADGFVLAHQFNYASSTSDIFILSPAQPIRYEIRSSGGTGSFRAICAQVSTEGSISESGLTRSVNTGATAITLGAVGTTYPLLSVRRNASYPLSVLELLTANMLISSVDTALWSIQINPTLSAPLTYSSVANSALQSAPGNGTITVTSPGTVIASGYMTQNFPFPENVLREGLLSFFGSTLAGVQDEYVFCVTPVTANVNSFLSLTVKEY